ncbi:MAG: 16S rRNA (adenine(1518)-N(6)/adenine(1519)-N(6))-dimethyltransferase RsmA [Candidatus Bathyarchaeia archaeon]|jgi:16S rRNA (adenine1518-N6/adenine1519-N6)-dimethyltransferase|nr:ribosomal RNA small subunit methyltransferase A [Candidatus Bathyarchaeota archaeon A05DMB-4]MDH7594679.1 16S rRNA (adenine(1518)-N(6)/adenine(1519)-N(6))-dimethyltransferase RsmA [Candidatus Bathyarchaeota archaeon]
MNKKTAAKQLFRRYGIFPKKRLGQNFMTDEGVLHTMAFYASLSKDDVVLEIGAGFGALTRVLAPLCGKVIAVEIDHKLIEALKIETANLENITLIEGNILEAEIPAFNKVVSNPPFHVSSPILFWLLKRKFDCAVLTFQKEFAERLVAQVGSRDYSRLTVEAYYRAEVERLDLVPKETFYPPPNVDARIVRLKPRKTPPFQPKNEETFHELVRTLFTQRNKKVRNAVQGFLSKHGEKKELADSLLFHDKRVRELAPEDFGALADEFAQ